MNDLTIQDFLDAGYTRWEPSPYHELETDMFEKCIYDKKGKKYFIHVHRWDFNRIPNGDRVGLNYESEVHFTTHDNMAVVVSCLNGWSIEEMEHYYEEQWDTGLYKYYEEYEYDEEGEEAQEETSDEE